MSTFVLIHARDGGLTGNTDPYVSYYHDVPRALDRFFPPAFLRGLVTEGLNIVPDEIAAGHCVALSRPTELADILERYTAHG